MFIQVDSSSLSSEKAYFQSAEDKRQSATNIGYLGMAMLGLVFGTIFVIDITSLVRDGRILASNLSDGFGSLCNCFRRR